MLGPDHPGPLGTRQNLVRWQGEAGDPAGAAEALEQLLIDPLRKQGPSHPHPQVTRLNLARWRGEAGDPSSARRPTGQPAASGPQRRPATTVRHRNLQAAQHRRARHQQAQGLPRRSRPIRQTRLHVPRNHRCCLHQNLASRSRPVIHRTGPRRRTPRGRSTRPAHTARSSTQTGQALHPTPPRRPGSTSPTGRQTHRRARLRRALPALHLPHPHPRLLRPGRRRGCSDRSRSL